MNGESANKFITALVKSLQNLCQGYVEFNDGIEIIGHLYLNIDSGSSFDYIVKEKLCKSAENSTVFVSKSYASQTPLDDGTSRRVKNQTIGGEHDFEDSSMSPTIGTARLQSAISNISNVLSGASDHKPRHIGHSLSLDHSHPSTGQSVKRKRDHNGSQGGMHPPYKYTTLQNTPSGSGIYFNSAKQGAGDRVNADQFNNSSHAEFFGGDSNQSSGMGPDEEDDLDLDVTFVKEELKESQRRVSAGALNRLSQGSFCSRTILIGTNTITNT